MNEATAKFVEKLGTFFGEMGVPRAAGQILALLLVGPEEGLTAAELSEQLNASTGSVSTMTRLLGHLGMVERLRLPGERRDRYRLRADALVRNMEERARETTVMRELMQDALEVAQDQAAKSRVGEMVEFYSFFEREIPKLIEKWRSER
jgi:DNA-binding transcriptional regulator GbsR (MarR family)